MDNLQWWGYIHTNGSPQAKRWFGDQRDIDEARESDFVAEVYGPFMAANREAALQEVLRLELLR